MATSEQRAISPDPFWWEAASLRRFEQVAFATGPDIVLVGADRIGAGRAEVEGGITPEGARNDVRQQGG